MSQHGKYTWHHLLLWAPDLLFARNPTSSREQRIKSHHSSQWFDSNMVGPMSPCLSSLCTKMSFLGCRSPKYSLDSLFQCFVSNCPGQLGINLLSYMQSNSHLWKQDLSIFYCWRWTRSILPPLSFSTSRQQSHSSRERLEAMWKQHLQLSSHCLFPKWKLGWECMGHLRV